MALQKLPPASPSLSPSKLLYVADKHNKCNYLIDTGAAVSVLPKSCADRTSDAACLPLVAANNTTINTYGNCRRVVDVGLKRDYAWTFIVADVKQPIIGADFLVHYSLLYRLTCAALSGEVASDDRDVLLQPSLTQKCENLKAILIERQGLTTPERVNKVTSGEKLGSDIPSRFLRRLQKTAGFGTKVVVGKAVIRQAFIRQMPPSVRAHSATQPDSGLLGNLAMLVVRAVGAEKDVDEAKPGVAEINVSESGKFVGLLEDLYRKLKKLETATAKATKKKTYGHS